MTMLLTPRSILPALAAMALAGGSAVAQCNPTLLASNGGAHGSVVVEGGYAFLTVWPKSAGLMPSLFGIGIGMLVGVEASAAIFAGGLIKLVVSKVYTAGATDETRAERAEEAGNDTMLAGASVFAAGAVVSIVWVVLSEVFKLADAEWFSIGGH